MNVNHLPANVMIGYVGETGFRTIEFDMTEWLADMPDGVPSLIHIRPGESMSDAYICATTFEDGILRWTVGAGDIGTVEGYGQLQVWLEEEANNILNKRGKSALIQTIVRGAITDASETVPEPQTGWMEQMTALKTATVQAAGSAAGSATAAAGSATDAAGSATGAAGSATAAAGSATAAAVSATAAAGSATDAAGSATDAAGSATAASESAASSKHYSEVAEEAAKTALGDAIDDTAGIGSRTKVWSADKLFRDFSGKADLENGKVPASQLPSYVDDVIEAASVSSFPATGESGKIYVALDTNKSYRWSGSTYTELSSYDLATQSASGLMSAQDKQKLDTIADLIYPVGSIYMNVNSTSPATLFGGTWEQLKDRFLLGAGDSYAAGDTGGSASHTLTTDEMPSHNHTFTGSAVTSSDISANHTHTGTSGNPSANHYHSGPSHSHDLSHNLVGWPSTSGNGNGWNGWGTYNVHVLWTSATTSDSGTGATGTVSAWHTHTTTTGNQSSGHTHSVTAEGSIGNTGSGTAFSIMPPYQVVYMWKRTA